MQPIAAAASPLPGFAAALTGAHYFFHQIEPYSGNMQTAIAEYAQTIGDMIQTRQWDDHTGKLASHSRFSELNKYDGKAFSELLNAVRAIYPEPETEFNEQPIDSLEQAEKQINIAYLNSGFSKFTAEFEKETVIRGADVYLFKVTFGNNESGGPEYGVIAKLNGAFIRGIIDASGEFKVYGGLGGFPKNSR